MTIKERKVLAEFALHFLKQEYWIRESGDEKRNFEQRCASFEEVLLETDISTELLSKLEPQILLGLSELATGHK